MHRQDVYLYGNGVRSKASVRQRDVAEVDSRIVDRAQLASWHPIGVGLEVLVRGLHLKQEDDIMCGVYRVNITSKHVPLSQRQYPPPP